MVQNTYYEGSQMYIQFEDTFFISHDNHAVDRDKF